GTNHLARQVARLVAKHTAHPRPRPLMLRVPLPERNPHRIPTRRHQHHVPPRSHKLRCPRTHPRVVPIRYPHRRWIETMRQLPSRKPIRHSHLHSTPNVARPWPRNKHGTLSAHNTSTYTKLAFPD